MNDTPISWRQVRWILDQGVPAEMAARMVNLRVVGEAIAFFEEVDEDLVFWSPKTGDVRTMRGRAFCLGSDNITSGAGVFAPLRIEADPLDWLRHSGRGIVIVQWGQTFDRLRDVPHVAVAEPLVAKYRRAMRPPVPRLSVITEARQAA